MASDDLNTTGGSRVHFRIIDNSPYPVKNLMRPVCHPLSDPNKTRTINN